MIGKTSIGKGFGGNLKYLMNEKKHSEILQQNNVYGSQPKELAHQFRAVSNENKNVQNVVWHSSLSFPETEKLTPEQMVKAAEKFLEKAGFTKENNQYLIIQHKDTKHQHVHICANRVGFDGKCVSDSYSKSNTVKWSKEVENELSLTRVRDKVIEKAIPRDKSPHIEQAKKQVKQGIDEYTRQKGEKSLEGMKAALKKQGIEMNILKHTQTGKEYGVSFKVGDLAFKGSEIGKNYAFQGITAQLSPVLDIAKTIGKIIDKGFELGM